MQPFLKLWPFLAIRFIFSLAVVSPFSFTRLNSWIMYHYEYFVYTDNLNYGRMFLGRSRSLSEAQNIGRSACRGCFVIERKRVQN